MPASATDVEIVPNKQFVQVHVYLSSVSRGNLEPQGIRDQILAKSAAFHEDELSSMCSYRRGLSKLVLRKPPLVTPPISCIV